MRETIGRYRDFPKHPRKRGEAKRFDDYIESLEDNIIQLRDSVKRKDFWGAERVLDSLERRIEQLREAIEEMG